MGRFRKRAAKAPGADAPRDKRPWAHYDEIPRENAAFTAYYRACAIVDEHEWPALMAALAAPLPATFRVTGHRFDAHVLRERLLSGQLLSDLVKRQAESGDGRVELTESSAADKHADGHNGLVDAKRMDASERIGDADTSLSGETASVEATKNGNTPDLPNAEGAVPLPDSDKTGDGTQATTSQSASQPMLSPIEWYKPLGTAWKISAGRKQVRTDAAYAALHKWLVAATEHGDISRQEAVSMVPPLLLDVRAGHTVLDMCAAPGSKTAQLVEAMHVDAEKSGLAVPTGAVVANDADRNRAYMLHHQVARILSPCLVVTNMDASAFPAIPNVCFDRVLADVPCSGDGTLRKNAKIWRDWGPATGMGLHPLQVRILRRGLDLLRPGGRLVYSTCSLNPLENEAVVAAVLRDLGGAARLVDVSGALPELVRRPGLVTWPVIASVTNNERYASFEDVPAARRRTVRRTMFPLAEYADLHLERCLRILPHLQDTGGFFVAVIEKTDGAVKFQTDAVCDSAADSPLPELVGAINEDDADCVPTTPSALAADSPLPEPVAAVNEYDAESAPATTPSAIQRVDEGDLVSIAWDHPTVGAILEYYGISAEELQRLGYGVFARAPVDGARLRTLTLASRSAASIIGAPRVRLVNAGVRAFELYEPSRRQMASGVAASGPCEYRVLSEAAALLLPLVGAARKAAVSLADLRALLLSQDSVALSDRTPEIDALLMAGPGGALLYAHLGAAETPLAVPVWVMAGQRAKAFVPAANRPALLMAIDHAEAHQD